MFGKRYNNCVKKEEVEFDEGMMDTVKDVGKKVIKKTKEFINKPIIAPTINQKDYQQNVKDKTTHKLVGEGSSYGITRGSGVPSGPMAAFGKKDKDEKKEKKAPRRQKGAMAYDGPNKERSEAADRVLAKAKKKREKMKEEYVGEMKGNKKSKDKNPQNMTLPKGVKSGVNYQNMAQSYVPVGNIFNEKKMDPVGQEDKDIDNDGDHDSTDKYLLKRRKAIGKAIAKKRGRVKEGFSAWRIDLDFNEQVKK